jgi:hypothetical protein
VAIPAFLWRFLRRKPCFFQPLVDNNKKMFEINDGIIRLTNVLYKKYSIIHSGIALHLAACQDGDDGYIYNEQVMSA